MRIAEIIGGIRIPLSEEEATLAEKVKSSKLMPKEDLTEREQELARQLVTKGIFGRKKIEDKYHYNYKDLEDIWRE